uniref:Uncharacterized protein n=1 Tax=Anopheles coluzzii TaxID=1518534 RepID=A0A8W7PQI8_ANOCL
METLKILHENVHIPPQTVVSDRYQLGETVCERVPIAGEPGDQHAAGHHEQQQERGHISASSYSADELRQVCEETVSCRRPPPALIVPRPAERPIVSVAPIGPTLPSSPWRYTVR